MWITTREQSREIDRRATEEFGIPSADLMEAAGAAIADFAQFLLPQSGRIVVFCGPGNNGGDGLVVARLLHKAGHHITLLLATSEDKLSILPRQQLAKCRALKIPALYPKNPDYQRALTRLREYDLLVDALLGTGATSEPRDDIATAIQSANESSVGIVSIDIPSGIDCDSGRAHAHSIQATHTLTIGNPKPFLFQGAGIEAAGTWIAASINFPEELIRQQTGAQYISEYNLLRTRSKAAHKGTSGRLLIVAGSDSMPGAAILAAHAALRAGIGLVTLASTDAVCRAASHHLPEIIVLPLPAKNGVIAPSASGLIQNQQESHSASIFGPGLTTQQEILALLEALWPRWELPSVVDADALNAISRGTPPPAGPRVFTPHPGELARLLGEPIDLIASKRFDSARRAQIKFSSTLLLKGPHSIVATHGNPLAINSTGNPGMATGGMGDALSGIIGTLLAQGISPHDSAVAGMFWHGLSGDMCAGEIGAAGYTATDLINNLPRTRAKLTLS